MEENYGLNGHNVDGSKRVFFRNNRSTEDMFRMAKVIEIKPQMSSDLDANGGCSESCELYTMEEAA
jgi:hypothetical protein